MPVPGPLPDDGFSIDPAQMGGVAGQIGKARDELTTAIVRYGSQETLVPGDFGSEVAGAWSNFDGAWAQELNVLGQALTELISKVQSAAASYAGAESSNTRAIQKVGA
jgi:uncharacterized protein YukE